MKNKKEPTRYVIFFSPRSGSTLLCNLLENSGFGAYFDSSSKEKIITKRYEAFGKNLSGNPGFGAYFNPSSKEKKAIISNLEKINWNKTDLSDFLLKIFKASENPKEIQGFKTISFYLDNLVKIIKRYKRYKNVNVYNILSYFPPNVKYIICYRKNILQQAVSHALARKNNEWFQTSKETAKNTKRKFDNKTIIESLRYIRKAKHMNEEILRKNNLNFMAISYEELIKDKKSCLLKVINYLGFNVNKVSIKEDIVKQSTINSKGSFTRFIFYFNVRLIIMHQKLLSSLFSSSDYLKKKSSLYCKLLMLLKKNYCFLRRKK